MITLGEGGTPLLAAPRLSAQLGVEVWLKWEGANPTGSFKDRGMAVAVGRALEAGAQGVVCASTGNTAASAAAYAARAGIGAAIVVPAGAVAAGKLAQVAAAGAELVEVDGDFGAAFEAAEALASERGYVIVNSTNPDRIEGQTSAAAEIVEQLGGVPDVLCLPYGGGGNTKAYALGFERAAGALPRIYPAPPPDGVYEVDVVATKPAGAMVAQPSAIEVKGDWSHYPAAHLKAVRFMAKGNQITAVAPAAKPAG